MAEIMILILFCLLMAFVLQLEQLTTQLKETESSLEQRELELDKYKKIEEESVGLAGLAEALSQYPGTIDDAWQKVITIEKATKKMGLDGLEDVVDAISNAGDDQTPLSPEDIKTAVWIYYEQKKDFQESKARTPSNQEIAGEVKNQIEQGEYKEKYEREVAANQVLGDQVTQFANTLEAAESQLQNKGKGLVFPSCFRTPQGRTQFIYNIEFEENLLKLLEQPVPGNEAQKARLPFDIIKTDQDIDPEQYLDMAEQLYDWSVQNKCRFFVRIFDKTLDANKQQYKNMKRYIESRFYIWERP